MAGGSSEGSQWLTCRTVMVHSPPVALAHAGLMVKHQRCPAARDKTLAAKRAGSDGKTHGKTDLRLETAQKRRCKCSGCCLALQLLPCMVIPRNIMADQPCLGWRAHREAVPGLWDVLSSPSPMEEREERLTGKGGMETFLSPVLSWLCKHYQCY